MIVAQLVEQSLPLSEVNSSIKVIGKIYTEQLLTVNCVEKTKIKVTTTRQVMGIVDQSVQPDWAIFQRSVRKIV